MKWQVAVVLLVIALCGAFDSSTYTFSKVLMTQKYKLYWRVDTNAKEVYFATEVNTFGWIGFGISSRGGMRGSDVVTGWIDSDGKGVIQDRFAFQKSIPSIDGQQDWKLISAERTDSGTILEFKRKLQTCDMNGTDVDITDGPLKIVFSYSDAKPTSEDSLQYHSSNRGSAQITLFGEIPMDDVLEQTSVYDIRMNGYAVPAQTTTYTCMKVELPPLERKAHIIQYEPIVDGPHTHHLIVFDCLVEPQNFTVGPCGNVMSRHGCEVNSYVWAVGQGSFTLPPNVGMPIGGNFTRWAILQIHYNNPEQKAGIIDNSGYRIKYTHKLRENDGAILSFGLSERAIAIPPGKRAYEIVGECPSGCTNSIWPKQGLTVFASFLHMHTAGDSMWTQHIRNGQELPVLDKNMFYDFDFQSFDYLKKPLKFLPGDRFITHCEYDTRSRTNITVGGEGTDNEMCLHFFMYYPRTASTFCIELTTNSTNPRAYCARNNTVTFSYESYTPLEGTTSCILPAELPEPMPVEAKTNAGTLAALFVIFLITAIIALAAHFWMSKREAMKNGI